MPGEFPTALEKAATIDDDTNMQPKASDLDFPVPMVICPPSTRVEFEVDLYENRPSAVDEAIERAIMIWQRGTQTTSSSLCISHG